MKASTQLQVLKPGQAADPLDRSNAQPIDDSPRWDVGAGVRARYGLCPVSTLQANPHNARTHSNKQIRKIARSIEVSGALSPVIVDETWTILAGHARVEACRVRKLSEVPVVQIFGASEAQKRTFLIADNRIGQDAGWDRQKLALEMPDLGLLLQEVDLDLTDTGFEVAELDQLAIDFENAAAGPDEEIDDAILSMPPVLRAGDLVQLGEHRLLVADARDAAALDRLRDGLLVNAAFLDPPYNRRVRDLGGRGRVKHEEFAFASGEMSRADFVAFLSEALGNAARISEAGAVHFISMDWQHSRDLLEAGEKIYGAQLNLVVWNKTTPGQGGLYRSQYELIGVFRVGDEPHRDNVQKGRFGRNRSNVWTYPGANTFRFGREQDLADHPTVKPTALVADAIKDVTSRGDVVLDTFVGSGTTILAGEKVGRRVLAMEFEPKYADVAVRRWEAMTHRDAVHVDTGMTFEALGASRRGARPRVRVRTK